MIGLALLGARETAVFTLLAASDLTAEAARRP
jgi:hypothetical protein